MALMTNRVREGTKTEMSNRYPKRVGLMKITKPVMITNVAEKLITPEILVINYNIVALRSFSAKVIIMPVQPLNNQLKISCRTFTTAT